MMLTVLWYGIVGFASCALVAAILLCALKERVRRRFRTARSKDAWLLQHFGEHGRKLWLRNESLVPVWVEYCEAKDAVFWASKTADPDRHALRVANARLATAEKAVAACRRSFGDGCFDAPHRTSGGGCAGLVMGRTVDVSNPPWGPWWRPYPASHMADPSRHVPSPNGSWEARDGHRSRHGEPMGIDWLAAGFWDPVMRDDGIMVDPVKVVEDDCFRAAWDGEAYGTPWDDGGRIARAVGRRIVEEENRTGCRSKFRLGDPWMTRGTG